MADNVRSSGDVNNVQVIGRLTADPELRHTTNGSAYCRFTVAVNRVYTSNGERRSDTSFLKCIQWGSAAEATARYGAKGRRAYIMAHVTQQDYKSRAFGDMRVINAFLEGLGDQKTVTVAKLREVMAKVPMANQQSFELTVDQLRWQDAPPTSNSTEDEAPVEEDVEELSAADVPF
ncbi:MAG: single-stranded DNA-binding protein [Candidatus Riesia sp.]|nr:single-stranded DNA-binding protein [Candidatus Riesia sp.]